MTMVTKRFDHTGSPNQNPGPDADDHDQKRNFNPRNLAPADRPTSRAVAGMTTSPGKIFVKVPRPAHKPPRPRPTFGPCVHCGEGHQGRCQVVPRKARRERRQK